MKKKILIIEDDTTLQMLLGFRFKNLGHVVDTAENGKIGLDLIAKNQYDLIVSDILMPVMSGLEVIKHVREDLKHQTPIILLSNAGQEEMVMKSFEIGATDFLSKPFSVNELLIRARKLIAA